MPKIQGPVGIFLILQLTGCALNPLTDSVGDITQRDDLLVNSIPERWQDENSAIPQWQELLISDQLAQLIQQAIRDNHTLLAQQARWRAAVDRTRVSSADLWPKLDVALRSSRIEAQESAYTGEVSVSWELDTWGRLRSARESSLFNERQQVQALQWAQYSLAADVARLYVDLIGQKQQWLLAQQREQSLQKSLQIIEDGYQTGIREALDVYSARAELAGGRADVVGLERDYTFKLKELSLLLGKMPGDALDIPDTLPKAPTGYTDKIRSDLLARRPDVKEALFKIYEQQANVKFARANRFPQFTLGASYGDNRNALADLFSGDDVAWSFLAGITAPVFNAGKLAAEQRAQQSLLSAQEANFKQVLLTAVKEAQQRLDDQYLIQQQLTLNQESSLVSDQAERQAFERYLSGIENLNTWLQAQRTAFQRRSQLVGLHSELIKTRIDLHLAVGGDFLVTTPETN